MARGASTFTAAGTAVSDIFAGFGDLTQAKGDILEQQAYEKAAALARQNVEFTKESTAIKEAQQGRELSLSLGRTTSEVAGAGFAASGSALDILRSSAQQGAIAKAVTGEQGLITEAGYQEQAESYDLMAQAAGNAAKNAQTASIGSFIAGGVALLAAI